MSPLSTALALKGVKTPFLSLTLSEILLNSEVLQVLEDNISRKISDIPSSNIFTDMSPRARDIKERNKWDLIKIKSFCTAKKKKISKMKRDPNVRENVFANHTSDKILISKIYKELT